MGHHLPAGGQRPGEGSTQRAGGVRQQKQGWDSGIQLAGAEGSSQWGV